MLIDSSLFKNKNIQKIVLKINKLYDKEKTQKFSTQVSALLDWLSQNKKNANEALYILSVLAEDYPESFSVDILSILEPFLTNNEAKIRLNACLIYGYYLKYSLVSNIEQDQLQMNSFLSLLNDPDESIRQNLLILLEMFPQEFEYQYLPFLEFFKNNLNTETNSENLDKILPILLRLHQQLTLNASIKCVNDLAKIYEASQHPKRSEVILSLIEKFIPKLEERSNNRWNKRKILNIIENRDPIIKCMDVNDLSQKENVPLDQVESFLLSEMNEIANYYVLYNEKGHRKILEFEKAPLIKYLNEGTKDLDTIFDLIINHNISTAGIVPVFLRDMIERRLIKGIYNKNRWYSWLYLISEVKKHLQHKGMIRFKQDLQYIGRQILGDLVDEIGRIPAFKGIFNQNGTEFYTYKFVTSQVEKEAALKNIIDMAEYREKYGQENQLKLEEYCKERLFTSYFFDHKWLTNIGLTHIQKMIQTCKQIGYCDLEKQATSLAIPSQILYTVVQKNFDRSNGFWNSEKTQYYFGKYIKDKITNIQNEHDAAKRQIMVEKLASKLDIDGSRIAEKVEEKLQKIAERLQNLEEFLINPLLKDLQMDQNEFLSFIDSFNKPYLVMNGKVIFSTQKIMESRRIIKDAISLTSQKENIINVKAIATRHKCSPALMVSLLEEVISSKEITGLWIETKKRYLTKIGIQRRMLNAEGYIDLQTAIEEIEPNEEQILFIEKILQGLIDNKELKGNYDPENQIYQSNEVVGEANLQVEIERFQLNMKPILEELEFSYMSCREVLLRPEIFPGDINEYQEILEDQVKKMLNAKPAMQRWINNANQRLGSIYSQVDKRTKGRKNSREDKAIKNMRKDFRDTDDVAKDLNDFKNWKDLIFAIEQKAGEIIYFKKQLKNHPEKTEFKEKLQSIYEYLGFSD